MVFTEVLRLGSEPCFFHLVSAFCIILPNTRMAPSLNPAQQKRLPNVSVAKTDKKASFVAFSEKKN